jgi:hypothetical protein
MNLNPLQKPLLSVLAGVDPKRYYLCLLGPVALGVSVGIQATITALLLVGPGEGAGLADQLTPYGQSLVRPEHDLLLYVAGAAFTLFMSWLMVWYWRGKLSEFSPTEAPGFMKAAALLEGVLAAASLIVYAVLLCSEWFLYDFHSEASVRPPTEDLVAARLLVPCVVALVCAVIELGCGLGQTAGPTNRFEQRHLRLGKILRYVAPVFILLVVGVPPGRWRYLAGQIFDAEGCHHLNFFVMGPALSFAHGKAFGTEIYSQYGIGWPLLATTLSRLAPLTYGNLVGMEIVYGCVYYTALFLLLRRCFQQELWAAFGVVLAIYWQTFSGVRPDQVIWQYPSSTMMRHPLDVWFFLALLRHQRSGTTFWAAVAGVAAGLGVFFETETGFYLLIAFIIYCVLRAGLATDQGRPTGWKELVMPPVVCGAAAMATLLPLLLCASRGTLFTSAFAKGWLEALVAYGSSGVGALPIAELPDAPLLFFAVMVITYLGVIAYTVLRGLHGDARGGEILLATLAAYGLAVLLLFISRSHPFNLCHAASPFAVLLTALLFRCQSVLPGPLQRSSLPWALAGGLALLLVTKPQFQSYPSLLGSAMQSGSPAGLSLRTNPPDVSGLPPEYESFVRDVQDTCSITETLAPDGKGVAVLDLYDTLLYSVAGACPWSRYAPLFDMALTQSALEGIRDDLIARSPKYVVTRGQNSVRPPEWDFVWAALQEVVTKRYVLCQTAGPYGIWALPNSALAHCRLAAAAQAEGRAADAIARYTEALRLEPDLAVALNNLAWIRAAHPEAKFRDGAEAVRLAERACRVTGDKRPMLIGTLAAAYAQAGRFDEAVAMAEKARTLALAAGQNEVADKDQQLLELFKARQLYHEPQRH